MSRIKSICFAITFTLWTTTTGSALAAEAAPVRSLKICVAGGAPQSVRQAAEKVLAAVSTHPLLQVMADGHAPATLTDSDALLAAKAAQRAFHHLVVVGLPDDPLVRAVWQREARFTDKEAYIFGFGHFRGDIGYVESDRNPFLHGRAIQSAPFEAEVVTITGSTPAGVGLAAEAFLKQGLTNGVVAAPGWQRTEPSLLARDPLAPDFAPAAMPPEHLGSLSRIGVTQATEDEYRGVLADAQLTPQLIWRWKYFAAGNWDGTGDERTYDQYSAGLHRRATGCTVWTARFATAKEAAAALPKIAAAAQLKSDGHAVWRGQQSPYGYPRNSPGPLALWQRGEWLIMSSLPKPATDELAPK
jgi:hypothetical protein